MRKTSFTMATAAVFVGLLSSFSTVAVAEPNVRIVRPHHDGGVSRNYVNRDRNRGNFAQRRYYSDNDRNNNYNRRHRGQRGFGFGGISIDLGGASGCGYSYRKWQSTGSRYWRSRYYDCVS